MLTDDLRMVGSLFAARDMTMSQIVGHCIDMPCRP